MFSMAPFRHTDTLKNLKKNNVNKSAKFKCHSICIDSGGLENIVKNLIQERIVNKKEQRWQRSNPHRNKQEGLHACQKSGQRAMT